MAASRGADGAPSAAGALTAEGVISNMRCNRENWDKPIDPGLLLHSNDKLVDPGLLLQTNACLRLMPDS
jgi:hypothetical protein